MSPPGGSIVALARRQPAPFAVLVTVLGGFCAFGIMRSDGRVWAFLLVVALVLAAVSMADRTAKFSTPVIWGLVVFACAHLCGGLLPPVAGAPTFYETWIVHRLLKYDQAVHFCGSALATAVAWQFLGRHMDPHRTSAVVQAQLAAGIAMGKGALNEVVEFVAAVAGGNVFIGDGTNTGWDLVFNFGGAVAGALWLAASGAARSTAAPTKPSSRPQVAPLS